MRRDGEEERVDRKRKYLKLDDTLLSRGACRSRINTDAVLSQNKPSAALRS